MPSSTLSVVLFYNFFFAVSATAKVKNWLNDGQASSTCPSVSESEFAKFEDNLKGKKGLRIRSVFVVLFVQFVNFFISLSRCLSF